MDERKPQRIAIIGTMEGLPKRQLIEFRLCFIVIVDDTRCLQPEADWLTIPRAASASTQQVATLLGSLISKPVGAKKEQIPGHA
jgi:hypothetical protein